MKEAKCHDFFDVKSIIAKILCNGVQFSEWQTKYFATWKIKCCAGSAK